MKPGVRKRVADMTPDEMRRKGSWAVRFYGRAGKLPALVDAHGRPTRFALTAHAWGEPVPTTVTAARRIAEKGRRLLARYRTPASKKRRPSRYGCRISFCTRQFRSSPTYSVFSDGHAIS